VVLPAGNLAIPELSNRVYQFDVASPVGGDQAASKRCYPEARFVGHDLRGLQMIKAPLNLPRVARWASASAAILLVIAVHNLATDGQPEQPVDDHEATGTGNWYFTVAPIEPDSLARVDYFFFSNRSECEKRWRELQQVKAVAASECKINASRQI